MQLDAIIESLIAKAHEGSYWDFKQKWHENNADLLKDIICMANNTSTDMQDGYIIFGIEDVTCKLLGTPSDNRKNQENIIGFLSSVQWSGEEIPEIEVRTVFIHENEIDVLIIRNKNNTPYYLLEDYSKIKQGKGKVTVKSGVIYSRVGDRNTDSDKCATKQASEFLWKKRFGLIGSDEFKVVKRLQNIENWYTNDEFEILYNREYSDIQIVRTSYELTVELDEGKPETGTWVMDFPYLFADMFNWNIGKNETGRRASWNIILEGRELEVVLCGVQGTRQDYYLIEPCKKRFDKEICDPNSYNMYYYYCKNSIKFLAYKLFYEMQCYHEEQEICSRTFTIIPVFENEQEHIAFIDYIKCNAKKFNNAVNSQSADEMFPHYAQYVTSSIVYKQCKTMVQWLNDWRLHSHTHESI